MSIEASPIEIQRLTGVARRELADAQIAGISPDGSFEHSYVAALTAATIFIRAHAERIHGVDHHRLTYFHQGLDQRLTDVLDRRVISNVLS